jgi:hypothetical protein
METDALRKTVAAAFAVLGAETNAPFIRTLLLKDRFFVGHCFRCGGFRAIWKPNSDAVEFFDADGQLLRTVSLPKEEKRAAA